MIDPMQPLSVLIFDADEEARRRWRVAIHGCLGVTAVAETSRVGEAIHLARRMQPHLIILDPILADWNERTIIRALRQWSPASTVVVTTPLGAADRSSALLAAGAQICLDKHRDVHAIAAALTDLKDSLRSRHPEALVPFSYGSEDILRRKRLPSK